MPSEHGKTVLAESRPIVASPNSLWAKTVGFFQPILPDSSGSPPLRQVAAKPTYANGFHPQENTGTEDGAIYSLSTRKTSSNSLYRPGSIFPSQHLVDSPETPSNETLSKAETRTEAKTEPSGVKEHDNILQARPGDSERFRQLLELIRKTPREERGVDDAELVRLLERFREDMQADDAETLESNYLVILRTKILPKYRPGKKQKVLPPPMIEEEYDGDEEEFHAGEEPKRNDRNKTVARNRSRNANDNALLDEDEDEELLHRQAIALKNTKRSRKPAPEPEELSTQNTTSLPQASPQTPPVYPGLTQLEGNTPVAPPPYQQQYQPQYGNSFGNQPSVSQGQPGAVVPVNYMVPASPPGYAVQGSWEHHSRLAAQMLRSQMEQSSAARTFSNEARLRLLELVGGNRNEAVKPFTDVDKPFNEFWGNQILGFSALLDDLGNPDTRARYTNAAFRFDEGLMNLRRLCPIRLKNVRFARDVQAFGDYLPRSEECLAGEKIDVYLELENPSVRRTGDGFNVSASLSYEIRSNSGNVIDKCSNISIQSSSPSQRRDYYVHLRVTLPEDISQGDYQLRICVTDLNDETMQFAEEQISMKVMPPQVRDGRSERIPR